MSLRSTRSDLTVPESREAPEPWYPGDLDITGMVNHKEWICTKQKAV
jgi:hypothetical protein